MQFADGRGSQLTVLSPVITGLFNLSVVVVTSESLPQQPLGSSRMWTVATATGQALTLHRGCHDWLEIRRMPGRNSRNCTDRNLSYFYFRFV